MEHIGRDLLRHPLSFAGAALATVAGVGIAALFGAGLFGFHGGPYIGMAAFVVLPTLLVLGLVLIPAGLWMVRRQRRRPAGRGGDEPELTYPVIDLNVARVRRLSLIFLGLTTVNILLLVGASYRGLEVMDSPEFCGSCHRVMDPERTAHARSPHARVKCVECHIGPGASWFVKSKLSGTWQLVSVALDLYPRPIPTPVQNLRPARDTCEQCHWPTKFVGDRLRVKTRHLDDAESTPSKTVLLLHVGGQQGARVKGIHRHVDPGVSVRYFSDATREKIGAIELRDGDGAVRRYETKDAGIADGRWRDMDCVDCHNRPTHVYRAAEEEVDTAIELGRIDRSLPFVRRETLKLLRAAYPSAEAARAGIAAQLDAFYASGEHALPPERRAALVPVAVELGDIWARNVWPSMKITWGTYRSMLGHEDAPGCFRCHDNEHATKDGRVLENDCQQCHELLAQDEKEPAILTQLGH